MLKKIWMLPLFAAISFYLGYPEQDIVCGSVVQAPEFQLVPEVEVAEVKPEPKPEPPKPIIKKSPAKKPVSKWKSMWVTATAYCPCERCCGEFADGRTATNTNAWRPGVAVDPRVIPLGSKVQIPGYGIVVADDVGGAIKGRIIDVRFQYHWRARQWGRKELVIQYLPR